MPISLQHLIQTLADGRFHSGTELGDHFQVSRAAVGKAIGRLGDYGLDVHSVRGKGYKLKDPLVLLDADEIRAGLTPGQAELIRELTVFPTLDSTNSHAMREIQAGGRHPEPGQWQVFLAEQQTGGRGRRGRRWVSPFGRNIYLTLVGGLDAGRNGLDGVSLATGLAVVRAMEELGATGVGLKWPNDVEYRGRKLAGVLLEVSGDIAGLCQLVVGVGINVQCDEAQMADVMQPWTDLYRILGRPVNRNALAACAVNHIIRHLEAFTLAGFRPFLDDWHARDVMVGKTVELSTAREQIRGISLGVGPNGALRLDTPTGISEFSGGEISLRRN